MVWACEKTEYNESVRRIESWSLVDFKRGRGRLKMIWRTRVEMNMNDLNLYVEMV